MTMLPGRRMGHDSLSSLSLGQPAKSRDASFVNALKLGLGGLSGISNSSLDESGLANSKVASGTRGAVDLSLASLSTSASFYGSGISDLRSAVVAQQKQVDGLVDKVAMLFSAMHAEVLQDVRSASQHGFGEVNARLAGLHRAEAEVDNRLAELRQSEEGLREWLQRELKVFHSQVRGEVQDRIVDCFGDDLKGMSNRLTHLEEDVKFVVEAPAWEAALERVKFEVHDELQVAREGLHESVDTVLMAKLHALEERVEERVLDIEHCSLNPAIGAELATHRNHLEKLEMVVQRGQVGMQNLGKASDQLQSQWAEWRPWIEKRIESLTQQTSLNDVKARIDILEQFRHRSEETQHSHSPLRDRLGSLEERLDSLHDNMKSVASSVKRTKHGDSEGAVALDTMRDRIDALAASTQQDAQRLQQRLNDVMRLGMRVDSAEAGLEAMQRQLLHQRGEQWNLALKPQQQPDSLTEVRLSQVQGYAQRLIEELRNDIELRLNQSQSQTQRLVDEMRTDLEAQRSHAQSFPRELAEELQQEIETGVAQAHASTKRLVEGLQQELEPRVGQIQSASQRLADELRQDFEARISQVQSSSKRSQDELRQELETRYAQLRGSTDGVSDELGDLQQEMEAQVMQCQDFLRQELEARLSETIGSTKNAIDEWRLEVEARMAETSCVATKISDQFGEVSEGLESRLDSRIEKRMEQTHSFAQRLMNELRQEVETQVQQMHSVSEQLAQHINQNAKDTQLIGNGLEAMQEVLEQTHQDGNSTGNQAHSDAMDARIAQVRGAVERLADEFNETSDNMSSLRTDMGKIRMDVSKDLDALTRSLTDVQKSVLELEGEQDTVTLSVAETAREAAGEAVAFLGKSWQQELQGSLARCDEGSTNCERCVEVALAKVGAMEGQLRSIADDLRSQLAQEGGSLIEALGSSVRLDVSPDPALAASIAAREMLTGHSPCRVRRDVALGDNWSTPQSGRPPLSNRPSLAMGERIASQDETSSIAVARNAGNANASVDDRLQEHDQAVDDLRQAHMALQGEVEGFLLERRVTRSLAGLERRGRSPQLTFAHSGRRAVSLDSIRLL